MCLPLDAIASTAPEREVYPEKRKGPRMAKRISSIYIEPFRRCQGGDTEYERLSPMRAFVFEHMESGTIDSYGVQRLRVPTEAPRPSTPAPSYNSFLFKTYFAACPLRCWQDSTYVAKSEKVLSCWSCRRASPLVPARGSPGQARQRSEACRQYCQVRRVGARRVLTRLGCCENQERHGCMAQTDGTAAGRTMLRL